MSITSTTYKITTLISAPKIDTDLLWGLSGLFGIVAIIYCVSIFYFRNVISRNSRRVREKKKEFSPMISEFLFYDEAGKKEEKINYIDLKIQIRELIKDKLDRKVLTEVLTDLQKDVSGNTKEELFNIYQDLELHKDAYLKLESWRWEVVSKGIFELTQMNVVESYGLIIKFINDKRSTIRKQAELAAVTLKDEGISYFLDNTKFRISEWQQLKLLDVIRNKEDFLPPPFRLWLTSKNNYVVLFALRLIKHYNQNDASASLIELVKHKNNHIKKESINCIKEFNVVEALPVMKMVFHKSNVGVKMAILDTIAHIGSATDIDFLESIQHIESTFIVKGKAVSALNTITPESILPSKDVISTQEWVQNDQIENEQDPEVLKEETIYENARKGDILFISEIDVNSEIVPISNPEDELKNLKVEFQMIEDALGPVSIDDKEVVNTPNKDFEEGNLELAKIPTVYEEVKIKTLEAFVNIDFLPLVVTDDKDAKNILNDFSVVFEEVLDVPFIICFDNLEISPEESFSETSVSNNARESFLPKSITEIDNTHILKIDTIYEEVIGEIDWSKAFQTDDMQIEILSLQTKNIPANTENNNSPTLVPNATFYENETLETMVLLENISELGDHREIPYLKFLLENERSIVAQERIRELIKRFKSEKGVAYFKITQLEAGESIFNELIERSDLESKLILLEQMITVGDEKEIPLLNIMMSSDEKIIRKKAKSVLETLMKRLALENSQETDYILLDDADKASDIFNVTFDVHKSKQSNKVMPTLERNENNGTTLFDHLCSMSNKFYNKFNG